MKVILTETVPGVGEAGMIKDVADGYARNYLIPKKLAVVATRGGVHQAEAMAEQYARKANKAKLELQGAAGVLQDKTVTIRARAGSENRLYGSVTPADIAEALQTQHGISIDRRKIALDEAIHRLGSYTASADFGQGVIAKFNIEVAAEGAAAAAPPASGGKAARASAEEATPAAEATTETAEATLAPAPEAGEEDATEAITEAAAEESTEASPS